MLRLRDAMRLLFFVCSAGTKELQCALMEQPHSVAGHSLLFAGEGLFKTFLKLRISPAQADLQNHPDLSLGARHAISKSIAANAYPVCARG